MEEEEMAHGWAARDSTGVLSPFTFPLRAMKGDDITLKVLYCGICLTDLCTIKNYWRNANYPVIPGHEIVGVVAQVGREVHKFKIGDKVGVGYMAGACRSCDNCRADDENYCPELVRVFNSFYPDGSKTYGGFADTVVVNEHFAVRVPETLPLYKVGPLLCAGITVYTPMKQHGLAQPGKHLGVVGLGGLGHLAVKFGKAFGLRVTIISSTPHKEKDAVELLGADSFIVISNVEQMKAAAGTMDHIISTSAGALSLSPLVALLKTHGKIIVVGTSIKPMEISSFDLVSGGKSIVGSMIGGMKVAQEMMEFAGEHSVTPEVEVVRMQDVNLAMERLEKGDVRYRFVVDVANAFHHSRGV
ncbi:hypothetical protein OPV22_023004 [Ensete ventricosum]|uniref:cinnamyl-alcohol dehydrogenase n=1 Tax=Ensete ventricosum TaxID=4639 RepID=A0AAV8QKU0_ENSVE|nr:hypothetical protein OPV22_023004 [Ensete ventricosum]